MAREVAVWEHVRDHFGVDASILGRVADTSLETKMTVDDFFATLQTKFAYSCDPIKSRADALDYLYDTVDELLLKGGHDELVREILRRATKQVTNFPPFPMAVYWSLFAITYQQTPVAFEREALRIALTEGGHAP